MKALLLASALLLYSGGCDDPPQHRTPPPIMGYWVTCQGTVRHVAYEKNGSHVVIETDDRQLFTVNLLDPVPPVWVGLRGQFAYESASREQGLWKNFIVWKRLPEGKEERNKQ